MAKQHYIPQFLLRNFSENGKSVFMAEKSLKPAFISVAVKDAAAENNAHDDETEMRLSKAECRHAEAVRRIMGGAAIKGDLWKNAWEVAAYATVRPPKVTKEMQHTMNESAARALLDGNSRHSSLLRDLDVHPFSILWATRGEIARVMFAKYMQMLAEGYAKEFNGGGIQVLQATKGDFILADCPLSVYLPRKKAPSGIPIPQHKILTLPLSNKIALEFYKGELPHNNCQLNEAEVAEINRRSVIMADRFVYAYRKDDGLLETIRKNASYFAGIENVGGHLDIRPVLPPDCDPAKVKIV